MAALVVAEVVSTFEGSMIYSALPAFYRMYDDPAAIGWIITAFMLVGSAATAICGRLGDLFGRKRLLIFVLGMSAFGSLVSAATDHLGVIIAGRALQGFAGAILPLCYGIVRECMPKTSVPVNIGIIAATASGGAGTGFILGGIISDFGKWEYIFIVSAIVAVLAILLVAVLIPASRQPKRTGQVDWIGGVLFVPGLILLLYALSVGEKQGWAAPEVMGSLLAGIVILVIWVLHERHHTDPMIDIRLLAHRQIGLALLIISIVAIGAMNIGQIVMVMLQQPAATGVGIGVSATLAGTLYAPGSVMGVIAGPLCGWFAARRGSRKATILATSILTMAWVGLLFFHHSAWILAVWMAVNGFAMGAIFAAVPNLIVEVAPADRTSEATGLAQIVRKITMGIGAQLVAITLATSTVIVEGGGAFPSGQAYALTYSWVAVACAIAVFLSFLLPKQQVLYDAASARRPNHVHA
jgi:MFS family permease